MPKQAVFIQGSTDINVCRINDALEQLQNESTNCAGAFRFTDLNLPKKSTFLDGLKEYLLQIEQYQKPYLDYNGTKMYVRQYDPNNLRLVKMDNLETYIQGRLTYWSNFPNPCYRSTVTEKYEQHENALKSILFNFLNEQEVINAYLVKDFDLCYIVGTDSMVDDILIETQKGVYVLHLGFTL